VWRVGNGANINIWSDPWIPSSTDRKVISSRGEAVYTRVEDLINPVTEQWDEELLRSILNPVDVNRILEIPLNVGAFDDFMAWNQTRTGQFSVRSAYHVEWKSQFGSRRGPNTGQGSPSSSNPVWKNLWKMKVPSKVKIFCWNALHGSLPLKSILVNRHVGTSGQCPVCFQGAEDVKHLLFTCPAAVEVWSELNLLQVISDVLPEDRSGSSILEILLRRPEQSMDSLPQITVRELVAVACWYIWWIRRRRTHDDPVPPVKYRATSILGLTANFIKSLSHAAASSGAKWMRPLSNYVKLNVDAAFLADVHVGATAAVIRDDKGQFLVGSCAYLEHVESAATAEAIAMRNGLELAVSLGCNRVEAESDAVDVINACNGEEMWWSSAAAIYADCISSIATLGEVKFRHCPRESNEVAHNLARFCYDSKNSCNWVDEPPSCILSKLLDDVTIL
jgi:ribonuclease HI